jgi:hypothetical protein
MRLTVVAAIASGALALSGCQLVFGLGDYVDGVDTTGAGGTGSTSGGAGGESASTSGGGNASTTQAATTTGAGGGDACTCVGEGWTGVSLVGTSAQGDPPTTCLNGNDLQLLYPGNPEVSCSPCGCTPGGCEMPDLELFSDGFCNVASGAGPIAPGSSCQDTYVGSTRVAGPVGPPDCGEPSGGELTDYTFTQFAAFCEEAACPSGPSCFDDGVDCVMAPGLVGNPCPQGFDRRYELAPDSDPTCGACDCTGSCNVTPYKLYSGNNCGLLSVFTSDVSMSPTSCNSFGSGAFAIDSVKQGSASPSCAPSMGDPTFQPVEPRTVCCRSELTF